MRNVGSLLGILYGGQTKALRMNLGSQVNSSGLIDGFFLIDVYIHIITAHAVADQDVLNIMDWLLTADYLS